MADRSGAALFGEVFGIIAEHVPESPDRDEMVRRLWEAQRDYDFAPYQMEADDALTKLGLARRGVDPEYPELGEVVLYGPPEETS